MPEMPSRALDELLREATTDQNPTELRSLLDSSSDVDIDSQDENGQTLLHLSVGYLSCALVLLEKKANVNIRDNAGLTPLHLAAKGDYVETVLQLVKHGAEVDITDTGGKTSLKVALDAGANTSANLLMILGADYKCIPDKSDEHRNQAMICRAFEEGKIKFGWGTIRKNKFCNILPYLRRGTNTNDVLLEMSSHGKPFDVFCRREDVAFQNCSKMFPQPNLQEDESIISDVFRYAIAGTSDVKCDVKIPIHDVKLDVVNRYKTVFLRISSPLVRDVRADLGLQQNHAIVEGLDLPCRGSTVFLTLAVIAKFKTEKFQTTNKPQKITSAVDNNVKVTIPPSGPSGPAEFSIGIRPVKPTDFTHGNITEASAFCTVTATKTMVSNHGTLQPSTSRTDNFSRHVLTDTTLDTSIDIELPRPKTNENAKAYVMGSRQGSDPERPNSWKPEQFEARADTAVVSGTGCGIFIVINAVKNFGGWVKKMVSDLYTAIKKCKIQCYLVAFFKGIETNGEYRFLVRVVLCRTEVDKLEGCTDYVKSTEVALVTIGANVPYIVCCRSSDDTIKEYMPAKYKENPDTVLFEAPSKTPTSYLKIELYKGKRNDFDGRRRKIFIPVMCRKDPLKQVPKSQFLSDTFLEKLATEIPADQWFPLGVYLGFKFSFLSQLEEFRTTKYKELLLKWRSRYQKESNTDILTRFLQASREVALPRLKTNMLEEVGKHKHKDYNLYQWHAQIASPGGVPAYDYFSPLDDIFVYHMAVAMCPKEHLLLQLDVPLQAIETEKTNSHDNMRRVFCKLVDVTRNEKCGGDNLNLFELVVETLKRNHQNVTIDDLVSKYVKPWIEKRRVHGEESHMERLQSILSKYGLR